MRLLEVYVILSGMGFSVYTSFAWGDVVQLANGFNAALLKPVSANITCGNPQEQYYNTRQGTVQPRYRILSICDASYPEFSFPARNLVDGNTSTSWQSTNNVDRAFISISLNQPFFGKQILFTFGDYRRPDQIAIYKSSDFGLTYQPWHFMVTSREECTSVFGIPEKDIFVTPDFHVDRILCQQYTQQAYEYGEQVLVELNGAIRGDGSDNMESPELMRWMNVTNLHIRFSGLYRKFDFIDTRWHHYVVSEIALIARCDCSGHGDGYSCPLDPTTARRSCTCADNTCGEQCNMCCPGFNQYAWRRGTRSSWEADSSTKCEPCNCHGHSSECYYDPVIAAHKRSLNMAGVYDGGGVCLNCKHNTAGINCEGCSRFYYRSEGVNATSLAACSACLCSEAGSKAFPPDIALLECVSDATMTQKYPGKRIGDCFCKANVVGRKCDTCKDTFYRLEASNPAGCSDCACHLPGTVRRSNLCDRDFFGQCPCKENVKGRDCSQCKDGYYDLRDADVKGCKWCDCDIGGSISPYICNKVSGVCTCRPHIYGSRCKLVQDGYYYPDLHYIRGLEVFFSPDTVTLSATLIIPHDANYRLLLYYSYTGEGLVTLNLYMQLFGASEYLFGDQLPSTEPDFCLDTCIRAFSSGLVTDYFLQRGRYSVEIGSSSFPDQLIMENIVAIPVEFLAASILPESDRNDFLLTCSVEANDMNLGTANEAFCLSIVYSMTVKFENGALPCNCNPDGAFNQTCKKYAGQCYCRPGVAGRDCSFCSSGFWKFSPSGCQACNCKGSNQVCHPVTGMCSCPPNTQGRVCEPCLCNGNSERCDRDGICQACRFNTTGLQCESCLQNYYGSAVDHLCLACDCHLLGSYNLSCNLSSGQCYCRPGVTGRRCDQCEINFFGLTDRGCSRCNCNALGSYSMQCEKSGQCLCLEAATGQKCDQCKSGYYGLPAIACTPCACNATGTVSGTLCTNDLLGTCTCKPGVSGRACDRCMRQYADFSSLGCKECPLCTQKLQDQADYVTGKLQLVESDFNLLYNLSILGNQLKLTEENIQRLWIAGILFDVRVKQGQADYEYLRSQKLEPWNSRHTNLLLKINDVSSSAEEFLPIANAGKLKVSQVLQASKDAARSSEDANSIASAVFGSLVQMNTMASGVVTDSYNYVRNMPAFNFDVYRKLIDAELFAANSVLSNVTATGRLVARQRDILNAFIAQLDTLSSYYILEHERPNSISSYIMDLQNIYSKGRDIQALLAETKELVVLQQNLIASTGTHHLAIRDGLKALTDLYRISAAIYERNKIHTDAISGGIDVQFFFYNPQNSVLRLNVLGAYHLVARDFPDMLSDPYFQLSIHPRFYNQGPLRSRTVQGTLNPTFQWPDSGAFQFFLTKDDLKYVTLIITLYDEDKGDEDDFLGEVEIDLSLIAEKVQQASFQQTYTLKVQGFRTRWSTQFVPGESGLMDLQQLLTVQIAEVNSMLLTAESLQGRAKNQANMLESQAQLLTSTFEQAKRYASKAVNAVNTYNEINILINKSIEASRAANASVIDITRIIGGISVSTMSEKALLAYRAAEQFLAETRLRNSSFARMQIYLRSETYGSPGVATPPRSVIQVNGRELSRNVNGHNVVVLDYRSGNVEQSVVFRTDFDPAAGLRYTQFLSQVPVGKIVLIVKQGEGNIAAQYEGQLTAQLLELGGQAPFFSGSRGSYVLLGYRQRANNPFLWTGQVMRGEGLGISELVRSIPTQATLKELLIEANATFSAALPQWAEINRLYPSLRAKAQEFIMMASAAPVVQAALEASSIVLSQAVASSRKVLEESRALLATVDDLTLKFDFVLSVGKNVSESVAATTAAAAQAASKVSEQASNVLAGEKLLRDFQQISTKMDENLLRLEDKSQRLKDLSAKLPLTVEFLPFAQSVYQILGYGGVASQNYFNTLTFDIRANTTNGLVLYLMASPSTLENSLGFYLKDKFLYFAFNIGKGSTFGKSLLPIDIGRWYRVHLSRIGQQVLFVLQDDAGYASLAQLQSSYADDDMFITLSSAARLYLSGLPKDIMDSLQLQYGNFYGAFDNVIIDGHSYNLWKSESFTGQRIYTKPRFATELRSQGFAVTLFGSGFIKHRVGNLIVSSQFAAVQLEYRTFRDNVVLFVVTGADSSMVFGVYISNGRLIFQFASSSGNDMALVTDRSIYNNGLWYRLQVSRNRANASLTVRPVELLSSAQVEMKEVFIDPSISIKAGVTIIFGAAAKESPVPAPVSGVFAGDMRELYISDSFLQVMQQRSFNSSLKIEEQGSSYYGMIPGQIIAGIRFYGYMRWLQTGSYAMITRFASAEITSMFISFKTTQFTGMLLYKPSTAASLNVYIGLVSGNILLILNNGDFNSLAPYVTSNLSLSDGRWHNMSLVYSDVGYQLRLDGRLIQISWFGNPPSARIGRGTFYLGGVPDSLSIVMPIPSRLSLELDVEILHVNQGDVNLLTSGSTLGVSYAGIRPGLHTPLPPPSCAASFPDLVFAPDPLQVRFGIVPWIGYQSYIGYVLDEHVRGFFASSFVITMSFRAIVEDGIIFYMADHLKNPTQYVSLELVGGRLRYEFKTGLGQVSISTVNKYTGDGAWYKVYLLRIYQFGAMLIPGTREYHNQKHSEEAVSMSLQTPLYIGGLPQEVTANHFVNRNLGYNGCLRQFEISSAFETQSLDFSKPDLGGTQTGTTSCYSNIEPGIYFNGSSYVYFDSSYELRTSFMLEFQIRTYIRSGLIFYLYTSDTPNGASSSGFARYALLEIHDGMVVFYYKPTLTQPALVLQWMDPANNLSYYLCDQKWHSVRVNKEGSTLSLQVDGYQTSAFLFVEASMQGKAFIGGLPENVSKPGRSMGQFEGCIRVTSTASTINTSRGGKNVQFGCPSF